jgi:hypothetical protein
MAGFSREAVFLCPSPILSIHNKAMPGIKIHAITINFSFLLIET